MRRADSTRFVRIRGTMVQEVRGRDIRRFLREWSEERALDGEVRNLILNSQRIATPAMMENLSEVCPDFMNNTAHSQIFYFRKNEHTTQAVYWARICREEYITEPDEQAARIRREKENIRQFLSGLENSGKVWISTFYVNPDGTEISDVRIRLIEGQKEGGEWSEDIQAAANTICFAFGVHPNMVGAVPGKSQSNNSGSDKRELYIMKQYTLTPAKHILLRALNLCFQFNGFAARPVLPIVQLNTLDTHTDAKIVTPSPAAGA